MSEKILFDTTYLLPLLGIKIKGLNEYDKYISEIFDAYDVYYHPISLIESKWELISLKKKMDIEKWENATYRYKQGLNYILKSNKLTQLRFTSAEIEEEVDYLIKRGYRDYFDLLIFFTAFIENLTLITEDDELKEIPDRFKKYEDVEVINWNKLIKMLKE